VHARPAVSWWMTIGSSETVVCEPTAAPIEHLLAVENDRGCYMTVRVVTKQCIMILCARCVILSTNDPEILCSALPLTGSQAHDRRSRTCVPLHNSHAHAATSASTSTPALCTRREPFHRPIPSSCSPRLCTHLHNISASIVSLSAVPQTSFCTIPPCSSRARSPQSSGVTPACSVASVRVCLCHSDIRPARSGAASSSSTPPA
jgi:hypothetical protein